MENIVPRIRTINAAYTEIKQADPNTSLTISTIRMFVLEGRLQSLRRGNRYLINMDDLYKMLQALNTVGRA